MKLTAQVNDCDYDLNIEHREDRVLATINGRRYDLQVRELDHGEYLLIDGNDVYHCYLAAEAKQQQTFEVQLNGSSYDVSIVDPKRLRSGKAAGKRDHGAVQILSPMPGKVVRVLVELGGTVQAGDGIVVVEAMKMQNEMKAPKAGTVVSLNVSTGATVNAADVLAVIE